MLGFELWVGVDSLYYNINNVDPHSCAHIAIYLPNTIIFTPRRRLHPY